MIEIIRFCLEDYSVNHNQISSVPFQFEIKPDIAMDLMVTASFLDIPKLVKQVSIMLAYFIDYVPSLESYPEELNLAVCKNLDPVSLSLVEEKLKVNTIEIWKKLCVDVFADWSGYLELFSWYSHTDTPILTPERLKFDELKTWKTLRLVRDIHYELGLLTRVEDSCNTEKYYTLSNLDKIGKHIPILLLEDIFIPDLIKHMKNIVTLEIRNSSSWSTFKLENHLGSLTQLKSFLFRGVTITDESALTKILKTMPMVEKLEISSCDIDCARMKYIEEAIREGALPNLTHLSLSNNSLKDRSVNSLFRAIGNCKNLKLLDLSYNNFDITNLNMDMLRNSNLEHLILTQNSADSQEHSTFVSFSKGLPDSIKSLYLDDIPLSEAFLRTLLSTLQERSIQLNTLSLRDCALDTESAILVLEYATSNVRYLNLKLNSIMWSQNFREPLKKFFNTNIRTLRIWIDQNLLSLSCLEQIVGWIEESHGNSKFESVSLQPQKNLALSEELNNRLEALNMKTDCPDKVPKFNFE